MKPLLTPNIAFEGILLVNKPSGIPSFRLVTLLRKATKIRKIGHAGTLDPFAEGLMILLIGKNYTKKSNLFLNQDKEYIATIRLGQSTDTYDREGQVTQTSDLIPTEEKINEVLENYQGTIEQVPPMYSAKKIDGKKLYELARKGIEVKREAKPVTLSITKISYQYPELKIQVQCSKGTYIRTLAHDIGSDLGCFGHVTELVRTKSGPFSLDNAIEVQQIEQNPSLISSYVCKSIPH